MPSHFARDTTHPLSEPPPEIPGEPFAPLPAATRALCATIWQMTEEMLTLNGERPPERRDRRRMLCHARQIAMYVCHVVLGLSLSEIGRAFDRDRTTVAHACHVVEDRRDDPAFDGFVGALERVAKRLVDPPAVADDA